MPAQKTRVLAPAALAPAALAPVVEIQLAAVRTELEEQRRFRIEQLDELSAAAAEAVAASDGPRLQVARVLAVAAEAALGEIDAALRRLDAGRYGTCEQCAEPIPVERLEVLPMSRLCTPCQYHTDSGRSGRRRASAQPTPTASSGRAM